MKGLLLKDVFTLTKQLKIVLVMIAVFAVMPGFSAAPFAIMFSMMMPVTALAYDERCKWDRLAAMMPYSPASIVLSKYVLGYIAVLAASVLAIAAQIALSAIKKTPLEPEAIASTIGIICVASLLQAVNLPFMMWLGVERGRIVFFILTTAIVAGGMFFADSLAEALSEVSLTTAGIVVVAVCAALNVISIFISIALYKKKR